MTSNASGYDKDTAFFDCIYVQTTPPVSTPSRSQATLRSAIRFVSPVRRPPIRASVSWL